MACRRIPLGTAAPSALATEIAAALAAGQLCVLPTETVYGLAVRPDHAAAVERLRRCKGRREQHEFTFHAADTAAALAMTRSDDPRIARLAARYWPGPLTLVLPARADAAAIGVRVPAHDFTRAVIAAAGRPLWLTSVNATGAPPLCDPAAIEREFGHAIAILVDDGRSPLGSASTVVRCTGAELEVLREGILTRAEVLATAAAQVLFVCTGNTCRSPLAEVLARHLLARELRLDDAALLARGIGFGSAGTATLDGMPASAGSQAAASELGLDLGAHRSRSVNAALVRRADRIYCLTGGHLADLLELAPDAATKTALLSPEGHDIRDPYGGDLAAYRTARTEIDRAVRARLAEWRDLLPAR